MATSYQPFYPEAMLYDSLTDLLSEGFPEETEVNVYSDGQPTTKSTIARLRANYQAARPPLAKLHRVAARANEGYAVQTPSGLHYAVALVTEDEPGWVAFTASTDLETAKIIATNLNRTHGISEDDARDIEISSMRAGRVR